jgi:hypothetical protein
METVGFTEPHKTERLRNVVGSTKDNRATWPIGTLLADVVERCSGMSRAAKKAARRIRMGAVYASLGVIREVIDRLPETDPDRATLQERLDCVLPLKVTGVVQEALIRVYDLEVTGDHEYSTNGFLSHNCEKSADVITTTYLNDEHRKNGTTLFCNLKNRDNPLIEPFMAKVEFACRRIYNLDSYQGADGSGMSIDDHQAVLDAMADV